MKFCCLAIIWCPLPITFARLCGRTFWTVFTTPGLLQMISIHRASPRSWLEVYQRTISATGGQPDARIEEARLKIHRFRDIGKLRLPVVSNSVELRQLYLRSFDSLLASEHAQAFFNNWFVSGRFESFQIIPCAMQGEEEATIMLCSMQMKTTALRPALYFWQILGGKCRCTP